MEEKNKRFKLFVEKEEELSEFVLGIVKEEADRINQEIQIKEEELKIKTSYISELDDKIEAGIFFVSNVSINVNFETLPLSLFKNGEKMGVQIFTPKQIGDIPEKSIKYKVIYFDKDKIKAGDLTGAEVRFDTDSSFSAKNTMKVDLVNLPKSIGKSDIKILNTYLKGLPKLSLNSIDINTFSVMYDQRKDLSIIVVIRNAYVEDVKLGALPLKVYDGSNNIVYEGVYVPKESDIKANTAVIKNILVSKEKLLLKNADLRNYRIEFR